MEKITISILGFLFLICSTAFSQDIRIDKNTGSSQPVPGYIISELQKARKELNEKEVRRLEKIIDGYYEKKNYNYLMPEASPAPAPSIMEDRWLPNDIIVHNGALKSDSACLDMKYAKDGYLYTAFIGQPQSGNTGVIYVYKSSNGGLNWNYVSGIQSTSYYFGQISLLVEKNGTVNDSMRVLVYYSGSTSSNMDNALIGCMSFRRDGLGWYNNIVATPSVGIKYLYPSACSDGWYNNAYSYMHVVFVQYTGNNPTYLWHCRTTDWGKTHLNSPSSTSLGYTYPSAGMKAYYNYTGDDTIYVACVYLSFGKQYNIYIYKTTGIPSNNWTLIKIFSGIISARNPKLTIVQQNIIENQKKMLLTYLDEVSPGFFAGMRTYSYGGKTWSNSQNFQPPNYAYYHYVSCTSDTNVSTGNYILVMCNSIDSIKLWKGSIEQPFSYVGKVNSNFVHGFVCPVPAIYRQGQFNYSTVIYADISNTKLFFDAENLTTGIKKVTSEIPDKFSLSQNYPNPFNNISKIKYEISKLSNVNITVYDILGNEVRTLVEEMQSPGTYEATFDGSNLSSGIYFYKLQTESYTDTKKMILLK